MCIWHYRLAPLAADHTTLGSGRGSLASLHVLELLGGAEVFQDWVGSGMGEWGPKYSLMVFQYNYVFFVSGDSDLDVLVYQTWNTTMYRARSTHLLVRAVPDIRWELKGVLSSRSDTGTHVRP